VRPPLRYPEPDKPLRPRDLVRLLRLGVRRLALLFVGTFVFGFDHPRGAVLCAGIENRDSRRLQRNGLLVGITLIGPAWSDARLGSFADALQRAAGLTLGATGAALPERPAGSSKAVEAVNDTRLEIVVFGVHMRGKPLNHELTEVARLSRLKPIDGLKSTLRNCR
jgi:hypothetical protein